jgi:hypothetical protein
MKSARMVIAALAIAAPIAIASPAAAASTGASCVGQALSAFGPAFGSDLGHQIAFEAQNPETVGGATLGAVVSFVAQADRSACPQE